MYIYKNECLFVCVSCTRSITIDLIIIKLSRCCAHTGKSFLTNGTINRDKIQTDFLSVVLQRMPGKTSNI